MAIVTFDLVDMHILQGARLPILGGNLVRVTTRFTPLRRPGSAGLRLQCNPFGQRTTFVVNQAEGVGSSTQLTGGVS